MQNDDPALCSRYSAPQRGTPRTWQHVELPCCAVLHFDAHGKVHVWLLTSNSCSVAETLTHVIY